MITKEVFCVDTSEDNLSQCRLTYVCWIPTYLQNYKVLLHLFGKKARIVGTFKSDALLIHEEIFGSTPDFSLVSKPALAKELNELLQAEQAQEEQNEIARMSLDLNDRKYKYSKEQLTKFLEFKALMTKKLGEELCGKLSDNTFCRFLDGYLFKFEECEKNMTDYLVNYLNQNWKIKNNLDSLKVDDFPEIIQKDFLRIIGNDKEGRPVIFFRIRNFTTEGTTGDRLALFNGVIVNHALSM